MVPINFHVFQVLGLIGMILACRGDVAQADHVKALLTDHWSSSRAAKRQVDLVWAAAGDHPTIEFRYAYQLVLTRQRRYREALTATDQLLASRPQHLPTERLRTWLHLLLRRPGDALGDLEGISAQLAAVQRAEPDQFQELAGWCGTAFGVLEGPLADKIAPARVERQLAGFIAALDPAAVQRFELRRAEVLRSYNDRWQELLQVQQQEAVEDVQQRQDEQDRLDQRLQTIAAELRALREQTRDSHDHYADRRREVESIAPPLVGAWAESSGREAFFGRQLLGMELEIWRLDELLAVERDPVRRALLADQRAAWIWQSQLDGSQWDQALVDRLVASQALDQVQGELVSLHRAQSQEQMDLARRQDQLSREQLRSERRQERLQDADGRPSGRVRSLRKSLFAITTYVEYPLEEERARLLR